MPSWNTPLYAAVGQIPPAGVSDAVNFPLFKNFGGRMRRFSFQYKWNGNEATSDTINLCLMKPGLRVKVEACAVYGVAAAANANLVLNVGDSNSAIRYANSLTVFGNTAANTLVEAKFSNSANVLSTQLMAPSDIVQVFQPPGTTSGNPYPFLSSNDQQVLVATVKSTSNVAANTLLNFELVGVDE